MSTIRENIAQNILAHRKRLCLSQKELAEKVGVKNLTTVSSWERGANSPNVEMLFNLCDLFGISLDELYGTTPEADMREYLKFLDYLKSLDYVITTDVTEWHEGEVLDDYGNRAQVMDSSIITLTKKGVSTTYTDKEFAEFQQSISKSVNFQVWDKTNQK